MLSQPWDDPTRWRPDGGIADPYAQPPPSHSHTHSHSHPQQWTEQTSYMTENPPSPFMGTHELSTHHTILPQSSNYIQQHNNNNNNNNIHHSYIPSSSSDPSSHHMTPDLTQLLDLLAHSSSTTQSWTQQPSSSFTIPYAQTLSQPSIIPSQSQSQSSQQPPYPSPHSMNSQSTSTSVSPIPVSSPPSDHKPNKFQKTSHKSSISSSSTKSKPKSTSSTSKTNNKMITPKIPEEDISDSLARRLKHRAIDANRRVRLSAGFDALQAIVAPGESHSQIVLLEKSGDLMRHLQSDAASLKSQLRILKRKRARRERGMLGIPDELSDSEDEMTLVKKEYPINSQHDRPSALFGIRHVNYFCDSNVMLSCTNLNGVLVDVNAALLRAFHLRAPEDRIGKFTLAPHTISLASSSQPFSQHLSAIPMAYQSRDIKPLLGPNPDTTRSPVVDSRTPTGLPSSNIVMRDGTVSSQPGLIKGATTNELVPYLPSVVKLQKLLQGQLESTTIIFEGIDGRGQRYHAKFTLWLLYNSQGKPEYIMAMCNPTEMIHFPNDSPPYYSSSHRLSASTATISPKSSSSSSSSTSTSPAHPVVHSPLPIGPSTGDLASYAPSYDRMMR